ncbi:MAG: hypothetical protein A3F78_16545 [Burkholderiales bacterium RIFCSPLOWO2_12_FULL_61_40]|nr:MAG: hypothetical protein A3F78_16545 [Burkholderiales bacterium RIFCSPLOWO2_12_FULL_61_40]
MPADYGVFAVAIAIKAFFDVFKDLGLKAAVIIERDDDHTNTLFTVQLGIALSASAVIFLIKAQFAFFLHMYELEKILPWICLVMVLSALDDALVTRYMRSNLYRPLFLRQIIPALFGGVASLYFAGAGYGVMALAWGQVIGRMASVLFLLLASWWWPRLTVDWNVFQRLFVIGKHVTIQQASGYLVLQADTLLVGKNLGTGDAGLYKLANMLTFLLPNALLGQALQVVFTDAAAARTNAAYLSNRYHQVIVYAFTLTLIYCLTLYMLAPALIPWVLGSQWAEIVPYVQIMGISVISGYLVNQNSDFAQILGIQRIYSLFSVFRAFVTVLALLASSLVSLDALVITWVAVGLLANWVNFLIFKKNQVLIRVDERIQWLFLTVWILFVLGVWNIFIV